jgi:hypothetical protein
MAGTHAERLMAEQVLDKLMERLDQRGVRCQLPSCAGTSFERRRDPPETFSKRELLTALTKNLLALRVRHADAQHFSRACDLSTPP